MTLEELSKLVKPVAADGEEVTASCKDEPKLIDWTVKIIKTVAGSEVVIVCSGYEKLVVAIDESAGRYREVLGA